MRLRLRCRSSAASPARHPPKGMPGLSTPRTTPAKTWRARRLNEPLPDAKEMRGGSCEDGMEGGDRVAVRCRRKGGGGVFLAFSDCRRRFNLSFSSFCPPFTPSATPPLKGMAPVGGAVPPPRRPCRILEFGWGRTRRTTPQMELEIGGATALLLEYLRLFAAGVDQRQGFADPLPVRRAATAVDGVPLGLLADNGGERLSTISEPSPKEPGIAAMSLPPRRGTS